MENIIDEPVRRRGRPRKVQNDSSQQTELQLPSVDKPEDVDEEKEEKEVKKRGRPRKSDMSSKEYQKLYYELNKELYISRAKEKYQADPEKRKEYNKEYNKQYRENLKITNIEKCKENQKKVSDARKKYDKRQQQSFKIIKQLIEENSIILTEEQKEMLRPFKIINV